MFDEKNVGSVELFNSGRLSQAARRKNDDFISLVDEIPMYPMQKSNALFKSAELSNSIEIPQKKEDKHQYSDKLNQFLSALRPNILSENPETLKDYSFIGNTEIISHALPDQQFEKTSKCLSSQNDQNDI